MHEGKIVAPSQAEHRSNTGLPGSRHIEPAGDLVINPAVYTATTFRQARGYLLSRRGSLPLGRYTIGIVANYTAW